VDGAEGVESVNELDKLVVTCPQPLRPVGARHSGAKGKGGARRIEIQDGSEGGGKRGYGCGGQPFGGEGFGRR
jgi:hypothetical protein